MTTTTATATGEEVSSKTAPRVPVVRHPRRVLAAAAGLGVLAEVLFDGPALGLSFPLFVVATLAALVVLAGREGWQQAKRVRLLILPMLALAAFVAVRDNAELTALNVCACVLLGGILVQGFSGEGSLWSLRLWELVTRPVNAWAFSVWSGPAVVRDSLDVDRAGALAKAHSGTVLRAIVITAPVLAVFVALLSAGDAAFAAALSRFAAWLEPGSGTGSALAWVCGAMLLSAGALAHALRRRSWQSAEEPATPQRLLGATESLSVCWSLVVLFACFAAVQAQSFFIERAKLIPAAPGIGWGTYTREGFVQLIVAAGLTLAVLVVLPVLTQLDSAGARRGFLIGTSALVALTLVILGTGVNRLIAYEEAYGFSVTRVFGHVFAFALGAVLLWRAVTLWLWPHRFAVGALAGAIGWVLTLDAIDPERLVVERNFARFDRGGSIDLIYVATLSSDALPALRDGLVSRIEKRPDLRWQLPEAWQSATLTPLQLASLCSLPVPIGDTRWQEANLSRGRARQVLDACPDE